ncbi:site-specific DNA-methyltransferase [Bacillus sp. GBSW2]|uniref:site-specific DNA-methyltransferase n=1 Tax=Bacillus sp. GBSW2 TaxID=2108541 RepID=UPI000D03EB15|nr:site-specific DNA-methyltransferase [Bacillus sp. GBSW2]PRS79562.1 site-specific DNA-methyltransferase [Bacillus sp. GBSW2]
MVNKMNAESLDVTAENIARLKQLFPEVLTDGDKIDFDMLKAVLGEVVETEQERYQFTWHGKKKMIEGAQKPSKGTLRPVPDKSKNFDTTENLYIEGDNLEVLKLLQKSYNGKIKMIYIDPPYNTGKDFVYKDNFKDGVQNYLEQTGQVDSDGNLISTNSESNGRFHTDWLNMMYARLKLARNLLTDDGVIFISIGFDEQANLRKICDEIYGENNFIETIIWNKRIPKNDKGIGSIHEYILVYSKRSDFDHKFTMLKEGLDEVYELVESFKKENKPIKEAEEELKKFYRKKGYDRGITLYNSLDENYRIWGKINLSWPNGDTFGPRYDVLHPTLKQPVKVPDRGWRWKKESFELKLDYSNLVTRYDDSYICGDIWFAKDLNTQPSAIKYLDEVNEMLLRTILSFKSDGGIEVENIFSGKSYFSYPKPVSVIKTLLGSVELKNDDIILDFFSGSATTAHAMMQLNAEDGGNRKFIMVQLPESLDESSEAYKDGYRTICDIGEERIRRAGEKIKAELKAGMLGEGVVDPDSFDIGFKVLKLDTSNIREWNVDFANLKDELALYETPFIDERSELDIVYEIMLKQGLELTYPIETFEVNGKKVHDIAFGSLFICLSKEITPDIAKAIISRRDEYGTETSSVIFSDTGFSNDSDKLNCLEILKDAGYPEDNLLTI